MENTEANLRWVAKVETVKNLRSLGCYLTEPGYTGLFTGNRKGRVQID